MPECERFYVREHSGYTPRSGGNAPMQTEVMVIDRDYCHRVVASYLPRQGVRGVGLFYRTRIRLAHALAERLNREHAG